MVTVTKENIKNANVTCSRLYFASVWK